MKLVTIVGTRPQFVKAAAVSRAIAQTKGGGVGAITELVVHTGQHYDEELSRIFFDQLGVPEPFRCLNVGSGTHGVQTGEMMMRIETLLLEERPDAVMVYGDCNSTLAGALAAKKLALPLAHVEAGLRSFNRAMPEEINRIVTDRIADVLYCPTEAAANNLALEGLAGAGELVGDVMYDCVLLFAERARRESRILERLRLGPKEFALCTIHRAENTDSPDRLSRIVAALQAISNTLPVILPLHPRTRQAMQRVSAVDAASRLRLIGAVSYLDMVMLESNARVILTDSGGVQKEAFFHRVPCVTLREETEWPETVALGFNRLAGADPARIERAFAEAIGTETRSPKANPYGQGDAAQRIARSLVRHFSQAGPHLTKIPFSS